MGNPCINVWITALAATLLLPLGLPAHAENSALPPEAKVFRFNVAPNGYPPYLISDDDQTGGIMWTVVEKISRRLGYQVETHKIPHKRVDQLLKDGLIDGTARAREWAPRAQEFVFTDPVVNVEEVVFFPIGSPHQFEVIEDLFSLTLVTHLGYHYPPLRPHFESGQIGRFDVSRDQDLFVYVLEGEGLDATVADRLVGRWILANEGMEDKFRASDATLSDVGFRVMLRPGWESFAEAFNRELATMLENGEIDAILEAYR